MMLGKNLEAIKKYISLKNDTHAGDILLVGMPGGISYATVHEIKPDIKKNWYIVRFTLLVMPPVECSWKLRPPQMCGEIFSINGEEHFMVSVALDSGTEDKSTSDKGDATKPEHSGKVVQLQQRKKGR